MPYKSIQGPLVLSLALIASGVGASGAPNVSQTRSPASQPLRSSIQEVSPHDEARLRFEQALAPDRERQTLARSIQNDIQGLRRYEPLAAADLVTHSLDGAASTVALRGSIGNGAAIHYSLAQPPRHGEVRIRDGRATYVPDPGFEGVDTYTYRVQSGQDSVEAVVAVTAIRDRVLPATAAAVL